MSASEIRRIALPDPHSTFPPRFVVGGQVSQNVAGDIKMYEWRRDRGEMGMVGLQTDVGQIRSMAWSPLPTHRNIIATGLSTGRTLIHSLSPSTLSFPLTTSNSTSTSSQSSTIASLNVKYSRPVTSIAFSSLDPNILATGYEKHRSEYSLLIWDISDAIAASQIPIDGDEKWERPSLENRLEVTNLTAKINITSEPRHIQHYCPSENVNSVSFLPNSINSLLVSVSNKSIRLCDLRSPSNSNQNQTNSNQIVGSNYSWNTRAVYGLTPNERREGMFASYEIIPAGANTHSIVRLWDMRKPGQEILNFDVAGGIVNLEWKKDAEGLLGVATRDKGVGLWEIVEGKRVEEEKVVEEWVVLGGMKQIVKPRQNLHSFSFAPSQKGQGDVMFVLKDGTIGIGPIGAAPVFATGPQGDLAILTPSLRNLNPDEIPPPSTESETPQSPTTKRTERERTDIEEPEPIHRANRFQLAPERVTQLIAERSRSNSPTPFPLHGAVTPASERTPYGSISGLREWYDSKQKRDLVDDDEQLLGGWEGWRRTLGSDVGVVMRRRAMEGYGLDDLLLNAAIATRHPGKERLAGIWEFIEHLTHVMAPPLSSYKGYNLTHHGVYPTWFGVSNDQTQPSSPTSIYSAATLTDAPHAHHPPLRQSSASAAWTSLKSQSQSQVHTQSSTPVPPHSRHSSSPMPGSTAPHRERKASDRRGGGDSDIDREYISAVEMLNGRRKEVGGIGRPGTVRAAVGGEKTEMRKLILTLCGENGENAKDELNKLVESGQRTKAAFRAYFAGDEAATVSILMASEDQHHRLLGSTIAGFMTQSASARGSEFFNSHWQGLVNRVDDPFVRSILSRIGGDDWESVLEEEGIPLLDRIGVGIQYLDDREFSAFLKGRLGRLTRSNSLHLLGLTGLSAPAISLLSRYLARTGDIQTVSIISCLFPLGKLNKNEIGVINRWKETYRDMLDSWGMWGERCEFDIRSGELARSLNLNTGSTSNLESDGAVSLKAGGVGERCPV
uniref:MIOS-like alpha-solenoid domain-containing protein n=1 Tax=Kwoniella dejecticola CBS 10117 TaxID=1296121 RepID=A0A1A6AFM5_9TREE|nr:uncharacterized protein I303_00687 [Kwoniella dejecticola CBS 10117]OBR88870.1 hypothetical protein I303_00687 [Kwoniella dejecticola CBS 10117]